MINSDEPMSATGASSSSSIAADMAASATASSLSNIPSHRNRDRCGNVSSAETRSGDDDDVAMGHHDEGGEEVLAHSRKRRVNSEGDADFDRMDTSPDENSPTMNVDRSRRRRRVHSDSHEKDRESAERVKSAAVAGQRNATDDRDDRDRSLSDSVERN